MQTILSDKVHATHHYKFQFKLRHNEIFERQAVKKKLFFCSVTRAGFRDKHSEPQGIVT